MAESLFGHVGVLADLGTAIARVGHLSWCTGQQFTHLLHIGQRTFQDLGDAILETAWKPAAVAPGMYGQAAIAYLFGRRSFAERDLLCVFDQFA